ncbi:MAG TPA: MFS transporter [Longimicrobiales bacterium]|nr:MFS transporter [Longimicrobiales bacterium]
MGSGTSAADTDRAGTPARGLASRIRGTIRLALRSLAYRNFRIYFTGQGISLVGTWMQRVAMGWLVYRLSGSAFVLGLVGFAGHIPTLLLAPFAGVAADRWSRKRILYLTQGLAMGQALVLAALTLTGVVAVWHVLVLALFLGTLDAFDIPARQSFFVHMIDDPEDLGNAIALNSTVFNLARLVGPSIAGILIALAGEGVVFALNGATYLSMLVALALMHTASTGARDRSQRLLQNLRDGFGFAWSFLPVRAVLQLVTVVSFVGTPFVVLMPVFATDVLGGGPDTLGFLMAAQGAGALAGALYLASRRGVQGLGRVIAFSAGIFGAGLIFFGLSRWLWLSLPLLALAGFGIMVQMAACNTFLQSVVGDGMRGRIMSLYTMAFVGTMPLGSLVAGAVAERVGAPLTVSVGGAASLVTAVVFARRLPALRAQARARLPAPPPGRAA